MSWFSKKSPRPQPRFEQWPEFAARYTTATKNQSAYPFEEQQRDCAYAYAEGRMSPQDRADYEEKWRGSVSRFYELEWRVRRLEGNK